MATTTSDGTTVVLQLAPDEVLVHPVTYAQLDGPPSGLRCVSIWQDIGADKPYAPLSLVSTHIVWHRTVVVARLRVSTSVVPQYVAVSDALAATLDLAPVTRLCLRVLKCPPLTPLKVVLTVPYEANEWLDALLAWWSTTTDLVLEPAGTVLELLDTPVSLTLRLRNEPLGRCPS